MADHMSTLIDSVKAVPRPLLKLRLMADGAWGQLSEVAIVHPGSRCTWTVEQGSTNPFVLFLWLVITYTLCVPALSWKGSGHGEEGYSIHPFWRDLIRSIPAEKIDEQRPKQCKDCAIVWGSRRNGTLLLRPTQRTTVTLIALYFETVCIVFCVLDWLEWQSMAFLKLYFWLFRFNYCIILCTQWQDT